jgi:hypothetical protein
MTKQVTFGAQKDIEELNSMVEPRHASAKQEKKAFNLAKPQCSFCDDPYGPNIKCQSYHERNRRYVYEKPPTMIEVENRHATRKVEPARAYVPLRHYAERAN